MIYVITDGDYQKIGYSKNPVKRVADLQRANARYLSFIAIYRGELVDEAKMHKKYEKHRVRGEWFALPVWDLEQIYFSAGNLLKEDDAKEVYGVTVGVNGDFIATVSPIYGPTRGNVLGYVPNKESG